MNFDAVVLGAGIVGVSVAIHLRKRGCSVALVDLKEPGNETSFGNAGLIQREGVYPYAFPRGLGTLLRYARNTSLDVRYHAAAMLGLDAEQAGDADGLGVERIERHRRVDETEPLAILLGDDQPLRIEDRLGEDVTFEVGARGKLRRAARGERFVPDRDQVRRIGVAKAAVVNHDATPKCGHSVNSKSCVL